VLFITFIPEKRKKTSKKTCLLVFDKKNLFLADLYPGGTSNRFLFAVLSSLRSIEIRQALMGRLGERVLVEPTGSGHADGGGSASLPASFLGSLGERWWNPRGWQP